MRIASLLCLFALTGCPSSSDPDPTDADADGVPAPEDCDDNDPAVFPGNSEVCDDLDNDCNTLVDDDADDTTTFYADADDDGYGSNPVEACTLPAGHSADPGDCDDADATRFPGATEDDCADPKDYNCDGTVGYADADGDGFAACQDCNDTDTTVHPGADELCNDIDDDCDASTDEDAVDPSTWYADTDTDGYGDAASTQTACNQPSDHVANSDDCNDAVATSFPGADELCNDTDDDCDSAIDEDAIDPTTWYEDDDSDGVGNTAVSTQACDAPTDFVATDGDCNDGDGAIKPGATEVCDGQDNDCNGDVDEDDSGLDSSTRSNWYADVDDDGFGDVTTEVLSCQPTTGIWSADATDCDDDASNAHPGLTEVCGDGVDNDCAGDPLECSLTGDFVTGDADQTLSGGAGDYFASRVTVVDLDDDGNDDVIVHAPRNDDAFTDAGSNYVFYGPLTGDLTTANSDATLVGQSSGFSASDSGADAGDIDGDGFNDLLMGNRSYNGSRGAASLFYGSSTRLSGQTDVVAGADASFTGATPSISAGSVHGLGDLNDDGYADFAIGAPSDTTDNSADGSVWIIYGSSTRFSGQASLAGADAHLHGSLAGTSLGELDTFAGGDVNGDGFSDLAMGDPKIAGTGGIWMLFGSSVKLVGDVAPLPDSYDIRISSAGNEIDGYGRDLAISDLDADGYADVAGFDEADGPANSGAVYIHLGRADYSSNPHVGTDVHFHGEATGDNFGGSLNIQDMNADGMADLLVGAGQRTTADGVFGGTIYVFYGPLTAGRFDTSAAAITVEGNTFEMLGEFDVEVADVDSDGVGDLLAPAHSPLGSGTVHVFMGGSL